MKKLITLIFCFLPLTSFGSDISLCYGNGNVNVNNVKLFIFKQNFWNLNNGFRSKNERTILWSDETENNIYSIKKLLKEVKPDSTIDKQNQWNTFSITYEMNQKLCLLSFPLIKDELNPSTGKFEKNYNLIYINGPPFRTQKNKYDPFLQGLRDLGYLPPLIYQ
jgi:hypothetical protein